MNRTGSSWLVNQTDHFVVRVVLAPYSSHYDITSPDRKTAEDRFRIVREHLSGGAELPHENWTDGLWAGDSYLNVYSRVVDVLGVFRRREITEKICVKGVPYEEQKP